MAREAGVRGFSKMTKAQLVEALSGKGREGGAAAGPKGAKKRRSPAKAPRKRATLSAPEAAPAPVGQGEASASERPPVLPAEDLGLLPEDYGEDRIAVIPRDPEWTFIHWEATEATWRAAQERAGPGRANLRVFFETPEGAQDHSDAEVHPRRGRYYARVLMPGCTVSAEVGVLDERGGFHPVLRSSRVQTPAVGPRRGAVRFMTVPPDVPLRDLRAGHAENVGRLLTEQEFERLFGRGHPGSIAR